MPLRRAFQHHVFHLSMSDAKWHDRYHNLLAAVNTAAATPDRVPDNLIRRLLFERSNGICNTNQGGIEYQINGYNRRFPDHSKQMPAPADFRPLISALLHRHQQTENPLTVTEYLDFRRQFTAIVDMDLRVVFNRLVIAMFPDQFVTPADDVRIATFLRALVEHHFARTQAPHSNATIWFDLSAHIARELRAGLAGVAGLDAGHLASFVWNVGIGQIA